MRRAAAVLVMMALGVSSALAQDGSSPLTPGDVALLANQSASESFGSLRRALSDADPKVRAVAARVAGINGRAAFSNALIGALAREQDPATGAEMVRGLLFTAGPPAIEVVRPQVRRLGGAAAIAFAEWLARTQVDEFIATLPDLVSAAGASSRRLADIVVMAATQHSGEVKPLRRAWMLNAIEGGWRSFLDATFVAPVAIDSDPELFKQALESDRESVREETVWFLVDALTAELRIPGQVLDAALPRNLPRQSAWEIFGRELIGRQRKNLKTPDASALIRTEWPRHDMDVAGLDKLRVLSGPERGAVIGLAGEASTRQLRWMRSSAFMRTLPQVTPGLIAGTLDRAGCELGSDIAAFASLTYRPDGRPMKIQVDPTGLTAPCQAAFTALTRLAIADPEFGANESPQDVMLPLTRGFVDCSRQPGASPLDPRPVPWRRVKPRKITDMPPVYPRKAQAQRIEGVVIIDSIITGSGCVSSGRVLRSIPLLDAAALWAVMQWHFEPPQLDGRPVAIAMTATVNFTLR